MAKWAEKARGKTHSRTTKTTRKIGAAKTRRIIETEETKRNRNTKATGNTKKR